MRYIILILSMLFLQARLYAGELQVCPGCTYTTVRSAVESAKEGDTIRVQKGVYKEGALIIKKRLHLIGEGWPVIDGEKEHEMLLVEADSFHLEGFRFQNSGFGYIRDVAAVKFANSRGCKIINNRISNSFFGIYLAACHGCTVRGNTIKGSNTKESNSGNGIHLWKSDSCFITHNSVQGQRDGLYMEFTKETLISHNISADNIRYGLHFMFSDRSIYEHNTFSRNGAGVAVMYTKNIVMRANLFVDNWGSSSYGLLLKSIDNSQIENNKFLGNTTGLHIESSGKLMIQENIFRSNGWAIKVMSSSTQDSFLKNNFIANTFEVGANGSLNANYFHGNHWDKYKGYDLDRDRSGDVPYRPVSLFGMITDKVPHSVVLMHSMVADILDQVEKVNPTIIPSELEDKAPAMQENTLANNPWSRHNMKQKEENATGNKPWGLVSMFSAFVVAMVSVKAFNFKI